jgi:SprT-like family.
LAGHSVTSPKCSTFRVPGVYNMQISQTSNLIPSRQEAEKVLLPMANAILLEMVLKFPEFRKRLQHVTFEVDARLKLTLGKALWDTCHVKLAPVLALDANLAGGATEDTIRHEIGHLVCPRAEGHGALWKALGAVLGYSENATYSAEDVGVSCRQRRNVRRRYVYPCPRCGDNIGLNSAQQRRKDEGLETFLCQCGRRITEGWAIVRTLE